MVPLGGLIAARQPLGAPLRANHSGGAHWAAVLETNSRRLRLFFRLNQVAFRYITDGRLCKVGTPFIHRQLWRTSF